MLLRVKVLSSCKLCCREQDMYKLIASEAEAAVEQEMKMQARRAGYAFAPLSARER